MTATVSRLLPIRHDHLSQPLLRSRRQRPGEVFVGGAGPARGALDVLGTLVHEADDALAQGRGAPGVRRYGPVPALSPASRSN